MSLQERSAEGQRCLRDQGSRTKTSPAARMSDYLSVCHDRTSSPIRVFHPVPPPPPPPHPPPYPSDIHHYSAEGTSSEMRLVLVSWTLLKYRRYGLERSAAILSPPSSMHQNGLIVHVLLLMRSLYRVDHRQEERCPPVVAANSTGHRAQRHHAFD